MVRWLGLGTFNAVTWVQSLVTWVQSLVGDTKKLWSTAKKRKKREISFEHLDESFFFFLHSLKVFIHIIFIFNFFSKYLFYLFLAVLGLCYSTQPCCAPLLHRGSKWRLLRVWSSGLPLPWPISPRSGAPGCPGFSSCGTWALEPGLNSCGARAQLLHGIVSCSGRHILNHWIPREASVFDILYLGFFFPLKIQHTRARLHEK